MKGSIAIRTNNPVADEPFNVVNFCLGLNFPFQFHMAAGVRYWSALAVC